MSQSLAPLLNIAVSAAEAAGAYIVRQAYLGKLEVAEKGLHDFVTQVDRTAEAMIIDHIRKHYPQHGILAEESGQHDTQHETQWIIDPIDGTTNFIHSIPHYCISIGISEAGKVMHGVVLDPIKQETFIASRGRGAFMNNKRMRVSNKQQLAGALLATGIPFGEACYRPQFATYMEMLKRFMPQLAGIRRLGSAALDLAYVACGRYDGYWELNLKPWDMAAGTLLVQEAGGLISDLNGEHQYMKSGDIVAANPKVFKAMLQTMHNESNTAA